MAKTPDMSEHYGLTEREAVRFGFFAGIAALCMAILGATLAVIAFLVTWPGPTRDLWMITATVSLLWSGAVICIFGIAAGVMAMFIAGTARRMGLAAAVLNLALVIAIYAWSTWPTANTLVGAAANGEVRTCKLAVRLGVDPAQRPHADRWDPRYGFTEHPNLNAIEVAELYGHERLATYLQQVSERE